MSEVGFASEEERFALPGRIITPADLFGSEVNGTDGEQKASSPRAN